MRARPLVIATLSLSALAGCTNPPDRAAGQPPPPGTTSATVSASVSPSPTTTAEPTLSETASASPAASRMSIIRRTDWRNVNVEGVDFMDLGDMRFRNGTAASEERSCTMLPGGARPAYADYLAEEPADSPATEDALVLVECGSDGMAQALIPVKLAFDRRTRIAIGYIPADRPAGPGKRMTFTSYAIEDGAVVATVRKADGSTETRRYLYEAGAGWQRS